MYLGIDLGTSEVKTLLVDDAQAVIASHAVKLAISRPAPQRSEQHPDDWVQALDTAIVALKAAVPAALAEVRAIAISGQMHGAVLLDAERRVLRPAILWNDTRSHAECAELEAAVPESREIGGNLMMPGFTAPKLAWLRKHEPDVYSRVATVMLPKDYLVLHLTGVLATEMSDAAGTLWLDVARRDWSDTLLAATGLGRAQMPPLHEGSQPVGTLREVLRTRWGMAHAAVVAAGAADNAASGVGVGAIDAGQGFVSLGSSGVIFVANDRFAPNPAQAVHAFCHALPQRWLQMTVTLSATTSLSWLTHNVLGRGSEAEVAQLAEGADLDHAPIFLPYLNGERTPHNHAGAQGMFFGLTTRTDAAALAYAVLEGVAFSLADGHAALEAAGTRLVEATLVGGGGRSRFWAGLVAAACGFALVRPQAGDLGGAFGAARLARLAATGEPPADVCRPLATAQRIESDPALAARLAPRLARYRRLYRQNRAEFG